MLGQKLGSRVAVTTTAQEAFGEAGNTQLGIGNKDTVLIIVDLMSPSGAQAKTVPSSQMPKIVEEGGKPTSLDFTGLPKPKADGDLERSIVKQGDGATVTEDMTLTVNYLGQVYDDAKKPFDESYSTKPATFSLQQVVKGWTYGLTGVKVGSRVLLAIPPDLGYGSAEQSGIPANSTLYFVVDVIKAEKAQQ